MSVAGEQWQQRIKSQVAILGEDELIAVFMRFLTASKINVDKHCRMISYKCYEATFLCNSKRANGYGRNEKEASVNCIRNLLEFLLEDRSIAMVFSQTLQKLSGQKSLENEEIPNESSSSNEYSTKLPNDTQQTYFSKNHCDSIPSQSNYKTMNTDEDTGSRISCNNHNNTSVIASKNNRQTATSSHFTSIDPLQISSSQNAMRLSFDEVKQHRGAGEQKNIRAKAVSQHIASAAEETAASTSSNHLQEDLRRARSYIEHLERKVTLVVEENNILKSLLMESKKSSGTPSPQPLSQHLAQPPIQQVFQTSSSYRGTSFTQQPAAVQNENIHPSMATTLPSTNKQPYYFPVASSQQPPPKHQLQQRSATVKTQPDQISVNQTAVISQKSSFSSSVLKDFSSNANIMSNILPSEQSFIKQVSQAQKTPSSNNEKYRSLSVDIYSKPSTQMSPSAGKLKLDTSLIETSSGMSLLGHSRYKSRIPKLNLEILPNYHGKSASSSSKPISQQPLQVAYSTQVSASTSFSKTINSKADKLK